MKRLLLFVAAILLLHVLYTVTESQVLRSLEVSNVQLKETGGAVYRSSFLDVEDGMMTRVAWQAAPPAMPIEERESFNWWWWVIGVALLIGGGVLLYFLIKKDPRHDVH